MMIGGQVTHRRPASAPGIPVPAFDPCLLNLPLPPSRCRPNKLAPTEMFVVDEAPTRGSLIVHSTAAGAPQLCRVLRLVADRTWPHRGPCSATQSMRGC